MGAGKGGMSEELLHVVTAGMPVVEECNVRAAISPVLRVVRLVGWLAGHLLKKSLPSGLSLLTLKAL